MLGFLAWRDDQCPGCGHRRSESMKPGNDRAYVGEPVQCHACRAARRAVDGWKSDELHGVYLSARKDS